MRVLTRILALAGTAAALAAIPASPAAALSLGGEELRSPSATLHAEPTGGDPYCGATQQGQVSYSTSGTAYGPYPGTFTETGHWSFDLINEQTYQAKFTITSPFGVFKGVVLYDASAIGLPEGSSLIANYGSCFGSQSGGPYSICESEALTAACGGPSIAYIGAEGFTQTFVSRPSIRGLAPTSGPTGTRISITGSAFTNISAVEFGRLQATFKVVSPSLIEATVPDGAKAGKVVVANPSGAAKSAASFTPTLSITGLSAASGLPGKVVKVKGVGFNPGSAVAFAGAPAAAVTYISPTELSAVVPAVPGTGKVTVTNASAPAGTVSSAAEFSVL